MRKYIKEMDYEDIKLFRKEAEELKERVNEPLDVCKEVVSAFRNSPLLPLFGATKEGYVKAIVDPTRSPGLSPLERIIKYSGNELYSKCTECRNFKSGLCRAYSITVENEKVQNMTLACAKYVEKAQRTKKSEKSSQIPGQLTLSFS